MCRVYYVEDESRTTCTHTFIHHIPYPKKIRQHFGEAQHFGVFYIFPSEGQISERKTSLRSSQDPVSFIPTLILLFWKEILIPFDTFYLGTLFQILNLQIVQKALSFTVRWSGKGLDSLCMKAICQGQGTVFLGHLCASYLVYKLTCTNPITNTAVLSHMHCTVA